VVTLKLKTFADPQPDFLSLPWAVPLAQWPEELAVRLPTGEHRHVVRFIQQGGRYFACKELSPRLAIREFTLLECLKNEGLPVVDLVGVALDRTDQAGQTLDAVLLTRHLPYSLPYFHLFAGPNTEGLHMRLVDALAVLLCRLHLGGFFWGDCSLGNVLFRRDAGALAAYVVDTETGELHDQLTAGQRQLDLDIAAENIVGGLFELAAVGRLDPSLDPVELTELLLRRYGELWDELTRVDEIDCTELWRIHERLRRLNELGFDTAEVELRGDDRQRVRFRPVIVEEGHHRRELLRLTGIEAEENQACRLVSDVRCYGVALAVETGPLPEAVLAYRWLVDRYQPTVDAVPAPMRGRLTDAELFNQVLDHLWFMSEHAARDVGLPVATGDYLAQVLATLPAEEVVIDSDGLVGPEVDQ
jgi:Domain of unknown function (DUF4032)/Lipopolysaccharide kinase (Kdo/WaaP) family